MTQICVSKLAIIVSDNGLSPGQAIFWTNAGILLIGTLRTNFSEIVIEIRIFSFKKMGLKVSSAKWQPFCPGLSVLRKWWWTSCVSPKVPHDSRCPTRAPHGILTVPVRHAKRLPYGPEQCTLGRRMVPVRCDVISFTKLIKSHGAHKLMWPQNRTDNSAFQAKNHTDAGPRLNIRKHVFP